MFGRPAAACGGRGRRCRPALLAAALPALLCLAYLRWRRPNAALEAVFYPSAAPSAAEPAPDADWLPVPAAGRLPADGCIFLLETSGRRRLTPREWCAVESAARAHPRRLVVLLVAAPRLRRSPLADRLLARNNTRLVRLRFGALFAGTPLAGWYRSRAVLRSPWAAPHMSDAVRFALLFKHGGVYLDTDVIVRRPLDALDDGAGLESEHAVAAGVLKFSRRSPLPLRLAQRFAARYDPHDWGGNGPGVVTEVLTADCGLSQRPLPPSQCGLYTIYGSRRFYALPWIDWRLFLEPAARDAVMERVDASYAVHTWALYTRQHPVRPGSAYHRLAQQHCPLALRLSGADF